MRRTVQATVAVLLATAMLGCPQVQNRGVATIPAHVAEQQAIRDLQRENRLLQPTPEDVDSLAARTQVLVNRLLSAGERSERWLGLSIGAGTFLVKTGQYAGGGGAVIFGLNAASDDGDTKAGKHAAYAGGVAAGVTALEDLFGLDKRRERAAGCRSLRIQQAELISRTHSWVFRRNDEAFRRVLQQEHARLIEDVTALYRRCVETK